MYSNGSGNGSVAADARCGLSLKPTFFNWPILSQTSLIEVGPDQRQQDQVQETNACTSREVGKRLCNILPSNYYYNFEFKNLQDNKLLPEK